MGIVTIQFRSLHKGIIPRAIHHIFLEKSSNPDSETSIHVSYLEVHNEVSILFSLIINVVTKLLCKLLKNLDLETMK